MKTTRILAAAALCLAAAGADAREPGTPAVMPSGATMGVPVGANFPQPGLYASSRTGLVRGDVYDANGDRTPVGLDINATAMQLHWTPGIELLGGSYRAMGIVAYQDIDLSFDGTGIGANKSISDFTLSPLNVHWMVSPGVFAAAGVSVSLPTGEFSTTGTPNGGLGAPALGLDAGVSYLRDGWNLTAHLNYFIHGENSETDYRSGNEVLLNWTAMKSIGTKGWSAGAVGYFREQVTDDRNDGSFYGGAAAGRLRESAVGIAVAKRIGGTEIYADYTVNTSATNTVGADIFRVNVTFPLGGKKK